MWSIWLVSGVALWKKGESLRSILRTNLQIRKLQDVIFQFDRRRDSKALSTNAPAAVGVFF
jgi:hypothetical protein